ncbi:DUF4175 family protein [Rhodothermus profundi]|uniref:Uncharacterized protein n=1 Tax=Rhodothermus profundi TaxID=633813 RepID=A0A1M6PF80_9BACT|nr:DUF4175 family protein [Rhodothermus profundi]SHK06609.1 hypothetical protein SAMN04488087_0160 [Rhodothermus profundi]
MDRPAYTDTASLHQRLARTRRRLLAAYLLQGGVQALGLLVLLWGTATLIEALLWLPVGLRTGLFWGLVAGSAGVLAWTVGRPLITLRRLSDEHLARQIGRHFPEIADRLVNLLQLETGRRSAAPEALLLRAREQLTRQIAPVPFEQMVSLRLPPRLLSLTLTPLLLLGTLLFLAPDTLQHAFARLLAPGQPFERPLPFSLTVSPGSTELARGDTLHLTITLTGTQWPEQLTIRVRYAGEVRAETFLLPSGASGHVRFTLPNLQRPLTYQVEAPPITTPWYRVALRERPLVRRLQLTLHYPSYTGLPAQTLPPNVGNVSALPGTRVELNVRTGAAPVALALLRFDDGTTQPMTLHDSLARGSFILRQPGHYWIELRTPDGLTNPDPVRYSLELVPDDPPTITLLQPEAVYTLDDALQAPLQVRVHDDFGFTALRLYWRLAESHFRTPETEFSSRPLPLSTPRPLNQELQQLWNLRADGLDLVPGDVVEYYVQVWDNDQISGPKTARTPLQHLRLPSLAERYEQLDVAQDEVAEGLESVREQAEQLRSTFQELRETIQRTRQAGWDEQQQAEQLRRQQEALEEQVETLARQLERITREMEANRLVSEETLELYQELQRVVEEIQSPELREALERLQEALRSLDLPRLLESMEQIEFNEAQFRERIERALALFRRLRTQQQLEEAVRRAEALARLQERLARRTAQLEQQQRASSSPSRAPVDSTTRPHPATLARQQEQASEEARQLESLLEEIRRQMESLRGMPRRALDSLRQTLRRQQLPERMQQNARQLRQGNFSEARQEQQQMEQQLEQLAARLERLRQHMAGSQRQLNAAGLRQALRHVLLLSELQETLRNEIRALRTERAGAPMARRQEQLVQGTRTVTDSLRQLARRIPQMDRAVQQRAAEALQAMDHAIGALTEGSARMASSYQTTAMMHLNELARMLADLLDQLQQQQGMGGLSLEQIIEQLQRMAGQQQQLNEQIQQLLNDIQGTRLATDQLERMRQLARQQEAIRRQLQQLARDREARRRLLGDLDALARQMQETIQELQQGQISRQTLERQRRILIRLLEAQHAIREQEQERRRQSRPGEDIARESPPELTPQQERNRLRRALIDALESGYAPDYEALIKRYFELLERMQHRQNNR